MSRSWLSGARVSVVVAVALAAGLLSACSAPAPARSAAPPVPSVPAARHPGKLATHHIGVRDQAASRYRPSADTWPAAGSATLTVSGSAALPAGTAPPLAAAAGVPVVAGSAGAAATVRLSVLPHARATAAGVAGVLFTAQAASGSGGRLRVGLNYSGFAQASGGNYGLNLGLEELPACALTTPGKASCRHGRPLASVNDAAARTVTAVADLPAPGGKLLLEAADTYSDGGGAAGSYNATTLRPSGTWTAGSSDGSFTYSYPMAVPPAAGGLEPQVGLNYDSGQVDGQTASAQAQASWAGDGWNTPQSFIEQSFVPCQDDPEGSAAPQATQDDCYDGPVLTLSLNGTSVPLVCPVATFSYTTASTCDASADNGEVITHHVSSGNGQGAKFTDYWTVITRDGTTYTFGLNHLPGWTSSDTATNSVDSEPVFSAHSGDPCYNATWSASVCTMAYRWNLDYVTDVHGNAMAYYYDQAVNYYAENGNTSSPVPYVRDSHLAEIDYGFTDGHAYTAPVPDRVLFTTGDRCFAGSSCAPLDAATAPNWPDVPYSQDNCVAGQSCQVTAPTFWSTVALQSVTAQQLTGSGSAYVTADSWALAQHFPVTGDGTSPTLWLDSVTRTGSDTTAGGAAVTLPPVLFAGTQYQNRVNAGNYPALDRYRLTGITSETGAVTTVTYELTRPCDPGSYPSPAANTSSCFPVYWQPFLQAGTPDWFNKYAVASVSVADPTGGSPGTFTSYSYTGAAWHYDDNEVVRPQYRTYGQWRGYQDVQTYGGGTVPATLGSRSQLGSGWTGYTMGGVTDLYGTGLPGVLARDSSGNLWYYPNTGGTGENTFGSRSQVGSGWTGFTFAGLADLNGSGLPGILARDSSGNLWYYPNTGGTGENTFGNPSQVGSGWTGFTFAGLADLYASGLPGILARDSAGNLWYYPNAGGTGTSTFGARSQVGQAWGGYSFGGLADLYDSGLPGIAAIDPSGSLWYYPGTGGTGMNTFGTPGQLAAGWTGYTIGGLASLHGPGRPGVVAVDSSGGLWYYPNASATPAGPVTENETTYYQGMSDDNNTTDVTLADSQGGSHEDADQLAGQPLETTAYTYAGGPADHSQIDSYWVSAAAASRSRTGLPALTATFTGQVEDWTRQALTDGGTTTWRTTETDTSYDTSTTSPTAGLPLFTYAHGDLSDPSGDPNQQTCTSITYAPANTSENLAGLPAETQVDGLGCGGPNPGGSSAPGSGQVNALTAPSGITQADLVSDTRTYYDDPSLATTWPQPASPAWPQSVPGNADVSVVKKATSYNAASQTFTYQTSSAAVYNSYGQQTASYDGNGGWNGSTYTPTTTAYTLTGGSDTTQTVTNPLGQATTTVLDPLRGLPVTSTDANGIATSMNYDGLGRLTAVWEDGRPTSSSATLTYAYTVSQAAPTYVTTEQLTENGSYLLSTDIYDALLRLRQTQAESPQHGTLVTDHFYDPHGWEVKTNTNWWDQSAQGPTGTILTTTDSNVADQTDTQYDGLGRPVTVTAENNSSPVSTTFTSYTGDKTTTVADEVTANNPAGTATTTVTDAVGRTTETDNYTTAPAVAASLNAGGFSAVSLSGGSYQATTSAYDTQDLLSAVTDQLTGEQWTDGYNLLGQVTTQTTPNSGATTMTYDADGNLTSATDALGHTITWTYDPLSRKTGEYDGTSAAAPQIASWTYDNSNNAVPGMTDPVGQLTTATSTYGGNTYTFQQAGFNTFGESLGQTVTLPGAEGNLAGTYTLSQAYSANTGLPDQTTYPASPDGGQLPAEQVGRGYTSLFDLPDAVGSNLQNTAYVSSVDWNALSQPAQEQLGAASGSTYLDSTFDPNTGNLTGTQVVNEAVSSTPYDSTSYTYDPSGNITSQTDVRNGTQTEVQCYTYDGLSQLTAAWTTSGTPQCSAGPSTSTGGTVGDGIPGSAYWTSWTYSPLGDQTAQDQHSLTGGTDTITTDTYNNGQPASTGQPDTLTTAATTGPGAGTATYSYNADGQTLTRDLPAGNQNLTWYDNGLLKTDTTTAGTTSYIYDPDGNLLLQKDPGQTTLYLFGEQLVLNTSTGAVTGTRFIPLPGGGTVVRTGTGTSYSFELTSQQNTGTLVLDNTGANPIWRQQTPYGAPRGTPPTSWPDTNGFLGKPADTTTGLTTLGARQYDPATGRFLSPDPITNTTNPSGMGGYAYANDNPVTNSDPTGLCPVDECGTGIVNNDTGPAGTSDPVYGTDNPPCGTPGGQACWSPPVSSNGGTAQLSSSATTAPTQAVPDPSANMPAMPVECASEFCGDPISAALWGLTGIPNLQACANGSSLDCVFIAAMVLPIGRLVDGAGDVLRGVWDLGNFERGVAIEQALGHNVPGAFPAIDIWDEATGAATSIKSLNLAAKTYRSASALSRTLSRYVDSVAAFQGAARADLTIEASQILSRNLTVAIPDVVATSAQWDAMYAAYQYGMQRGVSVQYVVVGG